MPPSFELPRDVGDGLRLRRATAADGEALATFNGIIHGSRDGTQADLNVAAWVRDLTTRPHPTFVPADFLIVEEVAGGRIVSSLNLISQRWRFDGIGFGVGRPELVGTLPEYRDRGLVRLQMEEVHRWSAARGELVQAITGIPYYYRLFGYEMALEMAAGREGYGPRGPTLPVGQAEPFRVRPAHDEDIPFIMQVDERAAARSLITVERDAAMWRYEISGRDPAGVTGRVPSIVESAAGERVGVLAHPTLFWESRMACTYYELAEGVSWLAVTPSVMRDLWARGARLAQAEGKEPVSIAFQLGTQHPAYDAAHSRLPNLRQPYAWYIRVADMPAFVRHIAPALERRLLGSAAESYSGELKLSFYRDGLRLRWERGRLLAVESFRPRHEEPGDAAFPPLSFLQALFGQRTPEELEAQYADCWFEGDTPRALLRALFPRRASNVWPIS